MVQIDITKTNSRNTSRTLFLLIASLLIGVIIAEVVLRVIGFSYPTFYRFDNITGDSLRPGSEGWYKGEGMAYVKINSQGMRDDREFVRKKSPDVYRVAVLGDSYAEALQVDVSKTFWRLLETKLNACSFAPGKKIEVLNFGVSGYSTAQELLTLRHRVKPFNPDLVLLAFLSGNDVRDNSKALANTYLRPFFSLVDGVLKEDMSFRDHRIFKMKSSRPWWWFQEMSNHSRLIQLVNKVKNVWGQRLTAPQMENTARQEMGLDDHIYLSSPSQVWEDAWRLTEALVAETAQEAKRQGADFLLVTLSNGAQVLPNPEDVRRYAAKLGENDLFYPERRMRQVASQNGISAVFLAEPFSKYAAEHQVYLHGFTNTKLGTGHWNEKGHALAAELIAQHLCPAGRK